MTSILTNNGAIVALQTLKMTNKNLAMTQSQISTGKTVNSAADGSAIWAVAKTMETDRDSFKTIQKGLNVAAKVVSTAVDNGNSIVDDLKTIKQRLTGSSTPAQDLRKNWNEIVELIDGIEAKINSSQINGINLLNKDGTGNGPGESFRVLASLDRSNGDATTSHTSIKVESANLKEKVLDVLRSWTTPASSEGAEFLISGVDLQRHELADFAADKTTYEAATTTAEKKAELEAKYTSGEVKGAEVLGKTIADQAALDAEYALDKTKLEVGVPQYADFAKDREEYGTASADRKAQLVEKYTVGDVDGATVLDKDIKDVPASAGPPATAAKVGADEFAKEYTLDKIIKDLGAKNLSAKAVESLIDVAITETAKLGAKQSRIQSQSESVGRIADSLTAGIGALVDADLEEASARLQALQAQQQLGIQALSIANQAPQSVLSLFR